MGYYQAYLDGQGVQDIAPGITVASVQERGASLDIQQSPHAKYDGTHVIGMYRRSKQITLNIRLRERHMEARARLLDQIQAWASAGGALTVNYRPHQRLRVVCTGYPDFGGKWKWMEELALVFTAYGTPFWEDENLTVAYLPAASTSTELAIQPPGTAAECFLRWKITNSGSGTLTALKLASQDNGSFITLNGLSIAPGGQVIGDYDAVNGYLTIRDGDGNSLLNKRNADSYDDIILSQRAGNTIRITADSQVTGLISARGLYL